MMTPKKPRASRQELARIAETGNIGAYLQRAREIAGLSQSDVAKRLKMPQFQSISQWERNAVGSIPIAALRKMVELYGLPLEEVYEVLLKYQTARLEEKLRRRFLGS